MDFINYLLQTTQNKNDSNKLEIIANKSNINNISTTISTFVPLFPITHTSFT